MISATLARALLLAAPLILLVLPMSAQAEAIPVELKQTEQGWQLLRGGEAGAGAVALWPVGQEPAVLLPVGHQRGEVSTMKAHGTRQGTP